MTNPDLAARLRAMFVEELDDQVRAANEHLLNLERAPGNAEDLRSLFRVMHTLKGAARSAGVTPLERLCHRMEAMLASARDEGRALTRSELDSLFVGVDLLTEGQGKLARGETVGAVDIDLSRPIAVRVASEPSTPAPRAEEIQPSPAEEIQASPEPAPPEAAPVTRPDAPLGTSIRVGQDRIDSLFGVSNRLLVLAARSESQPARVEELFNSASQAAVAWRRIRRALETRTSTTTGALGRDIHVLDEAMAVLSKSTGKLLGESMQWSRDFARLANETSLGVRELRMRPFADAVADLPRMARDVAAATGKRIRLEISGEEVQADRAVLAHIHDALMHLIRNAVDHGLGTPEQRRATGKPEEGTIHVAAALIGDRIVVTVRDDGGGIDIGAVRRAIAERGERVPDDDRAVARRLFLGGLSTKAAATAISGRGVGLDAVRAAVDRVRGSVDVDWAPGRGTTFTLEAPLTLATVRAVLARVGSTSIAIPSAFVERLMRVPIESLRVIDGRAAVETAGAPALIASVASVLGPPLVDRPVDRVAHLALVHIADRRIALRVDELLEEVEVVVRPIRAHGREPVTHITGAAMLPSGTLALMLNLTTVTATALGLPGDSAALLIPRTTKTVQRKRLLVVDDSITTRTLESSVLEAAGYEVATAVDGADGWRVLQEQGADLVVSDVEMPRMSGLQLCETMRASARFRATPLILVTALETPEDRAHGLEVGADAYLAKSSFEQESLLSTVRDLLGDAP